MIRQVLADQLLRGSRPGYGGEHGSPVTGAEVDAWIRDAKDFGARSIICILGDDQLSFYASLPAGLIAHYRAAGLEVLWVRANDHQVPPLTEAHLEEIWRGFLSLSKPVLVHCSAGVDRTGRAIEHILSKQREMVDPPTAG